MILKTNIYMLLVILLTLKKEFILNQIFVNLLNLFLVFFNNKITTLRRINTNQNYHFNSCELL